MAGSLRWGRCASWSRERAAQTHGGSTADPSSDSVATAAGSPTDPAWVADLRAQPRIEVELGSERFEADVLELDAADAEARVDIQAERSGQFSAYLKSAAPRRIPVFEIVPR